MEEVKEKGGTSEMLKEVESKRPKKSLSSYMIFVKQTRPIIIAENADMNVLDIMKEVGRRW